MMTLHKVVGIYEVFYSWIKHGLVCMEKDAWKHRKKMLSEVFNYNFITSHIPLMANIVDKVCEKF